MSIPVKTCNAQYAETGVTSARLIQASIGAAVKRFGKVDVWINNAGFGVVGRFTEVSVGAHDQVIATNLMDYLLGFHAVLPHFMARHSGVLVNVISFAAFVGPPFGASYTATKFGLRGLSESLRAELQDEPDIHVCDVFPGFVDTPGVGYAGNYIPCSSYPQGPTFWRVSERLHPEPRRKNRPGWRRASRQHPPSLESPGSNSRCLLHRRTAGLNRGSRTMRASAGRPQSPQPRLCQRLKAVVTARAMSSAEPITSTGPS